MPIVGRATVHDDGTRCHSIRTLPLPPRSATAAAPRVRCYGAGEVSGAPNASCAAGISTLTSGVYVVVLSEV